MNNSIFAQIYLCGADLSLRRFNLCTEFKPGMKGGTDEAGTVVSQGYDNP